MSFVSNLIVRIGADPSGLISGLNKGGKSTKAFKARAAEEFKSLSQSVAKMENAYQSLTEATARVNLGTSVSKQIKALEKDREKLQAQAEKTASSIEFWSDLEPMGMQWNTDQACAELEVLEGKIQSVTAQIKELQGISAMGRAAGLHDVSSRSLDSLQDKILKSKDRLDQLADAAKSSDSWLKRVASGLLHIGTNSKRSGHGVEGLLRSIRRLGIVSLGLRFMNAIFGELGSVVHQYISENAALQAQVNGLKSAFGQALAPAINVVTNALSALMPYVMGVSNAIGSLITNLFGSGWTTVAADANAAAKAIGGAGGAQKEFNRSLQSFDEITKLDSKSSGGGGGGGSGNGAASTGTVEGKTPVWLESLTSRVEKAIQDKDWRGVGSALADSLNSGIASVANMDVSIGSRIAEWINGGVAAATGLIEDLDWELLWQTVWTNLTDLFVGLFPNADPATHGGMSGGMPRWNAEVDVEGNITKVNDEVRKKDLDHFEAVIRDYYDMLGSKNIDGAEMTVTEWIDGISNRTVKNGTVQVTTALDNIKRKIVGGGTLELIAKTDNIRDKTVKNGKLSVTEIHDNAVSRTFQNGKLWINTVVDKAQSKKFSGGTLQMTSVVDKAQSKTFQNGKLWINTVVDKAQSKKLGGGTLQVTAMEDKTKSKIFQGGKLWISSLVDKAQSKKFGGGILQMFSLQDNIGDKTIDKGLIQVNAWKDNIGASNKNLTLKAQVEPGWEGSLERAMGITTLYSKLYLDTPDIDVKWTTSKAPDGGGQVNQPNFVVSYNARGAIFSAASLLGRVGNNWQVAGEAGREALLPLDRHTWWMDDIADRVVNRVGGGANIENDRPIEVKLIVDGKVLTSIVVRNVNAQARATGVNPLAAYL